MNSLGTVYWIQDLVAKWMTRWRIVIVLADKGRITELSDKEEYVKKPKNYLKIRANTN